MQEKLDVLESKLAQLVQLTKRLREENHHLRQELTQSMSHGRQCHDRIDAAKSRLEQLLAQLPEE